MTSKPGEKNVDQVAADANVILSAALGKAALKIFTLTHVKVVTTAFTLNEVREYLPEIASNYNIALEALQGQLQLLNIKGYPRQQYQKRIFEANRRMRQRDPEDAELLALTLTLHVPIWSNDNDFSSARVKWFTTAQLLKRFNI